MHSKIAAAELFRGAVSAGAFLEAEQLLELYRREVELTWNTATSAIERRAIAAEVETILEWARRATLSARSHTQRKLILLGREGAYTPLQATSESFDLDA